ncbi:hypothetical protein MXB_5343, partial [Myxobolus squamalis]
DASVLIRSQTIDDNKSLKNLINLSCLTSPTSSTSLEKELPTTFIRTKFTFISKFNKAISQSAKSISLFSLNSIDKKSAEIKKPIIGNPENFRCLNETITYEEALKGGNIYSPLSLDCADSKVKEEESLAKSFLSTTKRSPHIYENSSTDFDASLERNEKMTESPHDEIDKQLGLQSPQDYEV